MIAGDPEASRSWLVRIEEGVARSWKIEWFARGDAFAALTSSERELVTVSGARVVRCPLDPAAASTLRAMRGA